MIERHITFNVHPGQEAAFERFFRDEYAPEMAKAPGFIRVELLRESGSETRYQMAFRFSDGDSAVGWRTSTEHQALQPALNALHGGSEVAAYDVIA